MIFRAILRAYSYLFHAALALLLLGIAVVAWMSDAPLQLGMLPGSGRTLTHWLLGAAIFALVSLALTVVFQFRVLFVAWSILVFGLAVRGFFLQPYKFSGRASFNNAVYFTLAAFVAMIGALLRVRRRSRR